MRILPLLVAIVLGCCSLTWSQESSDSSEQPDATAELKRQIEQLTERIRHLESKVDLQATTATDDPLSGWLDGNVAVEKNEDKIEEEIAAWKRDTQQVIRRLEDWSAAGVDTDARAHAAYLVTRSPQQRRFKPSATLTNEWRVSSRQQVDEGMAADAIQHRARWPHNRR